MHVRFVLRLGNISYPYSDAQSGLGEWHMAGIYAKKMEKEVVDDSEGFWKVMDRMNWPVGLCEGAFYQTDDGMIQMLLRSTGDGYNGRLWITESKNDGMVWTQPRQTEFTDNDSKFHFGRLPDDRYYYVGNPDPQPRGRRNPLVVSVSEDGIVFDRHYILCEKEYEKKWKGFIKAVPTVTPIQ